MMLLLLTFPGMQFDGDVENVFCRCMQVEYECFGEMTTIDLVPDGGNIPVTAANREQYVQLFVQVHQVLCYTAPVSQLLASGCSWIASSSSSMHSQRDFLVFAGGPLSKCSNPKS